MKNNNKMAQNYVNILGIKILSTTTDSLLRGITDKIAHNSNFYITTPNSEMVLASVKNIELKNSLNSADFSVPDGVGLNYASRFLFGEGVKIIPGRILFERLIELSNKKGWKVFFLGGLGREAEKAAEKLKLNYKNIEIETFAGPKLDKKGMPASNSDKILQKEAVQRINKFSPELLFVAFGYPRQEIWIQKNLRYLNARGVMVVGGTFRYIAGASPLPPKWMSQSGLEWLWRLITEPRRIGRIFSAVIIFPLRILWFKISGR
jgi:N-acetylglucosaminyldiphosphoundecaprenol N-acetyl-beta-D-mannosaminyltransferase